MEFDDPSHIKHEKHAAHYGSYPELNPVGQAAALLDEDDKQRQLTTFESKFSDAKQPYVWGPGFMAICSVIAAIHMSDMSAQTNVLILDHDSGGNSDSKQNVIYVQLEDVGPKSYPQNSEPMLELQLPPSFAMTSTGVKQEPVKSAPATHDRKADLLKARQAMLFRNTMH